MASSVILGISSLLLGQLEKSGVLGPDEVHLRADARHRRYSRSKIEAFIKRLAAGAPVVDAAPNEMRPICASSALIGTGGLGVVVKEIMAGRGAVKLRLAGAPGLSGLLIDRDEFRALRRGLVPQAVLPFKDVAKLIGVDHETAAIALRLKLISAVETDGKGTMISRGSVDTFLAKYTTTARIVGPSRSRQLALRTLLAKTGVAPVISRSAYPRCKTNVYRVADVPQTTKKMEA